MPGELYMSIRHEIFHYEVVYLILTVFRTDQTELKNCRFIFICNDSLTLLKFVFQAFFKYEFVYLIGTFRIMMHYDVNARKFNIILKGYRFIFTLLPRRSLFIKWIAL